MAIDENKLCMGCMSSIVNEGPCSICGYDVNIPANLNFLPPKTKLADRYLVGRLTASDPEGAWYVGYDCSEQMRVWIREYAPANITRRDHSTFSVQPLSSAEAQYKALLADFEDLCRAIMRLPSTEKVVPITDIVCANNTQYAIYRYIKTITLESFLNRSGGKLSWRHTKKLLMPLYHTVANIHKRGLIHRGLSPYTVYLDQSGMLWVGGFSIAAARTNKSELSAQLFDGYSAPEQYALNSWQGTWTDVYSLGAITYRTVTGQTPPTALDRIYGDDLLDSQAISAEMNGNTINAINHALAFEVEDRIHTPESFIAELLATEGSNTAVYTAPVYKTKGSEMGYESLQREQTTAAANEKRSSDYGGGIQLMAAPTNKKMQVAQKQPPNTNKKSKRRKKARPVLSLALSALVATALLGLVMYWITTQFLSDLVLPDKPDSSSQSVNVAGVDFAEDETLEGDKVPRFVGATAESVKENAKLNQRFELVYQEVFNDDYEAGVIFDQQPMEGTKMPNVGQVTLFISKGAEKVEMPEVIGLTLEEAAGKLDEQQIKFDVIEVFNNSYEPGIVVRTDKDAGVMLDKNKDTVILYTKKVSESSQEEEREDQGDRITSEESEDTPKKRPLKKNQTVSRTDDGEEIIIIENDSE